MLLSVHLYWEGIHANTGEQEHGKPSVDCDRVLKEPLPPPPHLDINKAMEKLVARLPASITRQLGLDQDQHARWSKFKAVAVLVGLYMALLVSWNYALRTSPSAPSAVGLPPLYSVLSNPSAHNEALSSMPVSPSYTEFIESRSVSPPPVAPSAPAFGAPPRRVEQIKSKMMTDHGIRRRVARSSGDQ